MSRQRSMEVIEQSEYVTIGELVRLTGVRYSTLKFYTEEGMLPFEQAEENLTRRYRREESIEMIYKIRKMREEKNDDPGDKRENKRIKFFEENPGQIVRKLKSKKKRLLKRNATPSVVRDRQSQ